MHNDFLNEMREKLNRAQDYNDEYTLDDFAKEFSHKEIKIINDYKIKLSFVNNSNNPNPEYATSGSSGFDLRANLTEPKVISPNSIAIIPTGLFFEIPVNMEIQIRPRSGLAAKHGVTVLNTPGTIDADYRGEIQIILINHGNNDYTVNHGERIAQGVIASVLNKNTVNLFSVNEISTNTERGEGKFGSTGKN